MKLANEVYLEKAKSLTQADKEHLFVRMNGTLPSRLNHKDLIREECLAILLELEDEQLAEWRLKMYEIAKHNKLN